MTTEQKDIEDYFDGADILTFMNERVRGLECELAEKLALTNMRRDIGLVEPGQAIPGRIHNELLTKHNAAMESLHVAGRMIAAMKIVDEHRSGELSAFQATKAMVETHESTIRGLSAKNRQLESEITRLGGELEKAKKTPVPAKA